MLHVLVFLLLFQVTPAERARVAWVPNPRRLNSTWVADPSHHLSQAATDSVNAIITALEHATSAEIGVAIVDSLSGLEPQPFATTLHRVWGIGKQGKDNGVLLLWVPAQRRVFISVGYGLEGAIPDRRAGRIRDEVILSAFRASRFDQGMVAGVRALADAAREETNQRVGITPTLQGAEQQGRGGRGSHGFVVMLVVVVAVGIGGSLLWLRLRRHRPRMCPKGHGRMRLLTAEEKTAQLDKESQLEERIGSVTWDVWVCDTCGEKVPVPYRSHSGKFEDCPKCSRHTVQLESRVLTPAMIGIPGLKEVTRTCANCQWRSVTEEIVPAMPVVVTSSGGGSGSSSSSSGGGGGDFGGGSAGGAGAGGDY